MRVERLMIMLLGGTLVWALWKLSRCKLRKMWWRVKDLCPDSGDPKTLKIPCCVKPKSRSLRSQSTRGNVLQYPEKPAETQENDHDPRLCVPVRDMPLFRGAK